MAIPGRRIEVSGENVQCPIEYRGPFATGANLFVEYSIDGGTLQRTPLNLRPGTSPSCQIEGPEDSELSYRIFQQESGRPPQSLTAIKKTVLASATAAPHAPATPGAPTTHGSAPATPTSLDARVRSVVGSIFEDLKNSETTVGNLEARFDLLEQELSLRTGNQLPLILSAINEKIGQMSNIAPQVREAFHGKPPPATFEEFKDRLRKSSVVFRHKVYLAMKADQNISKSFHIKKGPFDPRNPFKDRTLNAIFFRVCRGFDLGSLKTGGDLQAAFNTVAAMPPTDPERQKKRLSALGKIIKRHKAGVPGFLGRFSADKTDMTLDYAVQSGAALAFIGGSAGLGLGLLALKPALEAVTGVRARDFVKAWKEPSKRDGIRYLWKTFLKNSIVTDWFTSEKTAGDFLKERLGYVLKGSVPVAGPLIKGAESVGGYEEAGEVVQPISEKHKSFEDMVRRMCQAEIGGGSASPSASSSAVPIHP